MNCESSGDLLHDTVKTPDLTEAVKLMCFPTIQKTELGQCPTFSSFDTVPYIWKLHIPWHVFFEGNIFSSCYVAILFKMSSDSNLYSIRFSWKKSSFINIFKCINISLNTKFSYCYIPFITSFSFFSYLFYFPRTSS